MNDEIALAEARRIADAHILLNRTIELACRKGARSGLSADEIGAALWIAREMVLLTSEQEFAPEA